jgi:O-antigen/teichoic acid export membrane protein
MARFKTVLRHSSYLFGSKIITRFLFTAFVIFAASRLGPELFGALSFSLAMVELLSWFGDLGLTRYGARELVREEDDRAVLNGQILTFQVLSSVVLCGLGLSIVLLWNPGYPKMQLLIMGLVAVLLSGVVNATESALIASQKFFYSALLTFIGRLIFVSAGFVALRAGASVVAVMAAFLAGVVVESILRLILVTTKVSRFSFRFPPSALWKMLMASLPFAVAAIAGVAYSQAGILTLEILRGDTDVGIYNMAYMLFIPFVWATIVLAKATLPGITELFQRDENASRYNGRQWYRLMAMVGMPTAMTATLLAGPVLSLFPSGYKDSSTVLIILMWSLPLALVSAIELNILQVIGRENQAARALMIAAAVTIVLDFILIPQAGVVGAAAATFSGAAVREALIYIDVRNNFLKINYINLFIKPALGVAAMGATAALAWRLGPWVATVLALTAYAATIFITGALKLSELKALAKG